MDVRVNPFQDRGKWFWRDEDQVTHGPYTHQVAALHALLQHCNPRSWWDRFKDLMLELVRA